MPASRDLSTILATLVAPRPLAWIVSRNASGGFNIAPFNSYTALANYPPLIGVSFSERDGGPKDTTANIEAHGDFTINVVTRDLADRMNESARECGNGTDDFARLGLTAGAMDGFTVPRIAESPAALACRMVSVVPLPPSKCRFIVAQVIGAFALEGYDPTTSDTLASVGPLRYAVVHGEPFTLPKTWK